MFHDEGIFAFPIDTTILYKGPQFAYKFEVVSEKKCLKYLQSIESIEIYCYFQ
jgi:hypothetical protein